MCTSLRTTVFEPLPFREHSQQHAALSPGPETAMQEILHDSDLAVDYAVVRDAVTLTSPQEDRPTRALIAASLGTIRLIDNSDVG
jgi:pantothenate synthetase